MSIEKDIQALTSAITQLTEAVKAASSLSSMIREAVEVEVAREVSFRQDNPVTITYTSADQAAAGEVLKAIEQPKAEELKAIEPEQPKAEEPPPPPAPEPEQPAVTITADQLRALAVELMQDPAIGSVKVTPAVKACGVESIKAAPESKYPEILAALEALRK